MGRVIEPFKQFLDDSGNPLTSGWLYFTTSGTAATDKDTYSDVNETTANANPLQLDASGRCGDVFGTGSYRVVSKKHNVATGLSGTTVQTFDPVTPPLSGGISDWSSAATYSLYDLVVGNNDLYYSSLANTNLNNDPISDATKWEVIRFIRLWNTNVTYAAGELVVDSDGLLWVSIAAANKSNDPAGPDFSKWYKAVSTSWGQGGDLASATALMIDTYGLIFDVTGTTAITSISARDIGTVLILQFDGILTLTHSNDLFLPTAGNITTAAGDIGVFYCYATGDWRCISYTRADGTSLGGARITVTTQGDIIYATASKTLARLAKGTALQGLQMNAGATAPAWAASPQSVLAVAGDILYASSANVLAKLAKGTAGQLLTINEGATAPEWATPHIVNCISGLIMSNDTDTEHDIATTVGICADSTRTQLIRAAAIRVKRIDAAWADSTVVTTIGGFPSSGGSGLTLAINTWYHYFAIGKSTDNTAYDFGYDSNIDASVLLNADNAGGSDYNLYRRIGSVLTDGSSNILNFVQIEDMFYWKDPPLDVNAVALASTLQTKTLSVPPDVNVMVHFNYNTSASSLQYFKTPTVVNDEAPSASAGPLGTYSANAATVHAPVMTNTSKQITVRSDGTDNLYLVTIGWQDFRGVNG